MECLSDAVVQTQIPRNRRNQRRLDSIYRKGFMTGKKKPAGERAGVLLSNG